MAETGYEGKTTEPFIGNQRWLLKRWPATMFNNVMGILEVYEDEDRSVRGYLEFKSEEEFKWAQARLEGDRRVDPKEQP